MAWRRVLTRPRNLEFRALESCTSPLIHNSSGMHLAICVAIFYILRLLFEKNRVWARLKSVFWYVDNLAELKNIIYVPKEKQIYAYMPYWIEIKVIKTFSMLKDLPLMCMHCVPETPRNMWFLLLALEKDRNYNYVANGYIIESLNSLDWRGP